MNEYNYDNKNSELMNLQTMFRTRENKSLSLTIN